MEIINKVKSVWRHYIPALFAIALGFFFIFVPFLAVFLISGLCFAFGLFYGCLVNRIHGLQRGASPNSQVVNDLASEPTFRNVTIRMGRNVSWMKDVT